MNIISLYNSGDSFEKSVVLRYTAEKNNPVFYSSDNSFVVFYQNNLPKTDECRKNGGFNVHGTLGFYITYFGKYTWCPIHSEKELLDNKVKYLQILNRRWYVTERVVKKLLKDDVNYLKFIKNIPMEYLFPEFMTYIKFKVEEIFKNTVFKPIRLEDNFLKILADINLSEKELYKIYFLELDGSIGNINFSANEDDPYYFRKLSKRIDTLYKKPVLSGNSAYFISAIADASKNMNGYLGYRFHKSYRESQVYALNNLILKRKEKHLKGSNQEVESASYLIEEPRNDYFRRYYDDSIEIYDLKFTIAIAKAYEDFINEYSLFSDYQLLL